MAKKRRSKKKKSGSSRNQVLIGLFIVIVMGAIYMTTGTDLLGLFTEQEPEVPIYASTNSDWWQVYFTNPNSIEDEDDVAANLPGSVAAQLITRINNAQESIHIASFEFNLTPVAEALIAAHERGVEVQWVTDDEYGLEEDEDEGHGQFAMLEEAGIEIVDDQRGALMHNKFWLFDGKTTWTGSTNITTNGNFRNNNNVLVIESPELTAMFEREFQEMWTDRAFGPTSPSSVDEQRLIIDDTEIQVLFAAEDEAIDQLIPVIQAAEQSITFMAFSFTHDALQEAIQERVDAGVVVEGIFETRGSETEYSALPPLFCQGLDVRQDGNPGTFHHKVIIIDDTIVATGSFNFSNNANDSNDENMVIVRNADIAAQYLAEFQRRWQEATPPDPADMGC